MKNITEAELNKAIATPPNSSLPQLDTSCMGQIWISVPWSVLQLKLLQNKAIQTTNLFAHCQNISHISFFAIKRQ
jgi:hypothetical protein